MKLRGNVYNINEIVHDSHNFSIRILWKRRCKGGYFLFTVIKN